MEGVFLGRCLVVEGAADAGCNRDCVTWGDDGEDVVGFCDEGEVRGEGFDGCFFSSRVSVLAGRCLVRMYFR